MKERICTVLTAPVALFDKDASSRTSLVDQLSKKAHVVINSTVIELDSVKTVVGYRLHVALVVVDPIRSAVADVGSPRRHPHLLLAVAV